MSSLTFQEALLTLEGAGPVLEVAREVSRILDDANIQGAIIGGVAVSLHGYLRTTVDVDVFVEAESQRLADELVARGYVVEADQRQFVKQRVPVHIMTRAQLETPPQRFEEIQGMRTVVLADLISMKLRSGTRSMLRAQDLGDVIGLIRHHRLGGEFASQIDKSLRREFRKFVTAIEREQENQNKRSS